MKTIIADKYILSKASYGGIVQFTNTDQTIYITIFKLQKSMLRI